MKMQVSISQLVEYIRRTYKNFIAWCIVLSFCWVVLYRFVPPPATVLMLMRALTSEESLKYDFVYGHRISPHIKVCAMASEDQNLPFHSGMDIEAIRKAAQVNKKGRKVFGASTISQQVAKTYFYFHSGHICVKDSSSISLSLLRRFTQKIKYWSYI